MQSFKRFTQPGMVAMGVAFALMVSVPQIQAQTVRNWLGGTCDLAMPGNWDTFPAATEQAYFNTAGCHTPTIAGNFNPRYIRMGDGGYTFSGAGTITLGTASVAGELNTYSATTADTVLNVANLVMYRGASLFAGYTAVTAPPNPSNPPNGTSNLIINAGTFQMCVGAGSGPSINAVGANIVIAPTVDFTASTNAKTLTLNAAAGKSIMFTNGFTATTQLGFIECQGAAGGRIVMGASTDYTAFVDIYNSDLEITSNKSLGLFVPDGSNNWTWISDSGAGALVLTNNLTGVTKFCYLAGRGSFSTPHIRNKSGDNTMSGGVWLDTPGAQYAIQSDGTAPGDIIRIAGGIIGGNNIPISLSLQGTGAGIVNSDITQLAEALSIEKNGTGTWTLAGNSTHTGATTVNQGTLTLTTSGSVANSSTIQVKNGATFKVSGLSGGGITLSGSQSLKGAGTVTGNVTAGSGNAILPGDSVGTLTVSGNINLTGGSTLQYELDINPAGANDKIAVGGNLTMSGVTTVALTGSMSDGLYRLFDVTGTVTATPANFTVSAPGASPGQIFTIITTTAHQVNLQVAGSRALTWVGGQNSNAWDVNATPNWMGSDTRFLNGDQVVFSDSGSNSPAINVATAVVPNRIGFTNSSGHNYIVSGGSIEVIGDLVASGSGTVTLANTDLKVDGKLIQGGTGTVRISNTGTLTGPVAVNSGTVALNRADDIEVANTITGAGTLVKEGSNLVFLDGDNSGFTGSITVASGILQTWGSHALGAGGSVASGTTVLDGATLDVLGFGGAEPSVETVTLTGTGVGGAGALTKSQDLFGYVNGIELAGNAKIANPVPGTYFGVLGTNAFIHGNGHDLDLVINDGGTTGNAYTEIDLFNVGDIGVNNLDLSGSGVLYLYDNSSILGPNGTVTLHDRSRVGFLVGYSGSVTKPIVSSETGGGLELYNSGLVTVHSPVTLNGDFEVNLWSDGTAKMVLTGKLTGPGSLKPHTVDYSPGVVAITSDANDYAGPTVIGGGGSKTGSDPNADLVTLSVGDGGATGKLGPGDVIDNWILSFNRTGTYSVPNNISGPGDVDFDSAGGVVSLTSTNLTYTGITRVNAGTLKVNGLHTTGALYTVGSGATLDLTGSVATPLTTGALTLSDNAALSVRLGTPTSTTDDSILVAGTADLSAATTLTINATAQLGGSLAEGHYVLISAGTLTHTGTPALVFHGPVGQTAHLSIGGATLYLTVGNPPPVILPADIEPTGGDGDVDIDDMNVIVGCAQGPGVPYAGGCDISDLDQDGDVDQTDFGIWQACFNGMNVQASRPNCTSVLINP